MFSDWNSCISKFNILDKNEHCVYWLSLPMCGLIKWIQKRCQNGKLTPPKISVSIFLRIFVLGTDSTFLMLKTVIWLLEYRSYFSRFILNYSSYIKLRVCQATFSAHWPPFSQETLIGSSDFVHQLKFNELKKFDIIMSQVNFNKYTNSTSKALLFFL